MIVVMLLRALLVQFTNGESLHPQQVLQLITRRRHGSNAMRTANDPKCSGSHNTIILVGKRWIETHRASQLMFGQTVLHMR